jgi:DNA uptake protein ComE-like DNA-binding protein
MTVRMKLLDTLCCLAAACTFAASLPCMAASPQSPHGPAAASSPAAGTLALVDINAADLGTLQQLPGVTGEVAAKIISRRPYPTKAHLLTRKVVSEDVYEAIRKNIVARPAASASARKAALAASKPR